MSIMDLPPGQRARVTRILGSGAIRQRMLDMGLVPQTELWVQRRALMGDPVWIKLNNFQLSLRRAEAEAVLVEAA